MLQTPHISLAFQTYDLVATWKESGISLFVFNTFYSSCDGAEFGILVFEDHCTLKPTLVRYLDVPQHDALDSDRVMAHACAILGDPGHSDVAPNEHLWLERHRWVFVEMHDQFIQTVGWRDQLACYRLDQETEGQVIDLLSGRQDPWTENLPFELACYGNPEDVVLYHCNHLLEAYGIEALRVDGVFDGFYGDVLGVYVNMGDSYAPTIIWEPCEKEWFIGSTADYEDIWEERYAD